MAKNRCALTFTRNRHNLTVLEYGTAVFCIFSKNFKKMLAFSDLLLYNEFVEWVTKCTSYGSYKYAFHTLFLHKYLHRENDGFCPSFFLFPAFFFSAFCPRFFLSFFARTFHLPFSEPVLSVAFRPDFWCICKGFNAAWAKISRSKPTRVQVPSA